LSNRMDESLARLALLKRHNGTDAAELDAIYECVMADPIQLSRLAAHLHRQNRATVRALWRFIEKQLVAVSDEAKKSFVVDMMAHCDNKEDKLAALSLVLSSVKCIFETKDEQKIAPSVYQYIIELAREAVTDQANLTYAGTVLKLVNQLITKNASDSAMFAQIEESLFSALLTRVNEICYQRNVDFMSAACIVLANVVDGDQERLGLMPLDVKNAIFEVFVIRSILALRNKSQVHFCLDRLVLIITSCRQMLEPTHLCNAVRGLAEALQLNREDLDVQFYCSLDAIFEALAEHPLDVVRVNVWKMYKLSVEAKLTKFEANQADLRNEMVNVIKNRKVHKRFDMVKLSAFCGDERTYRMLCGMHTDLASIVIRSSAYHLSPIGADVIASIVNYDPDHVARAFLTYWAEINSGFASHNEKRLFIDVLVPKVLKPRQSLAPIILDQCQALSDSHSIQFSILINKCIGREFEACSIKGEHFEQLLASPNIDLRLSTLAYIVTTKKVTQVLTPGVFELVKRGLIVNFNLQRPFHRKLLENALEHLVARLNASWCAEYESFLTWLIETCLSELCPGAALPRIKTILFTFGQLADQPRLAQFRRLLLSGELGARLHRKLTDQFSNSFADVNQLAFDILNRIQSLSTDNFVLLPQQCIENNTSRVIERLRCDNTLSSCTGLSCELGYAVMVESRRECIPVGKLTANIIIDIIELVEADMKSLSLLDACQSKPHYNLLSSIQFLLPYVKDIPSEIQSSLIKRILDVSFVASEYAEPVVNSNSPEGFLPAGFSVERNQDASELAKQLLVMAWRMMKASSTMLGVIGSVFELTLATAKAIGDHLIDQLTQARHRGTFELAAEAFRALCIQTRRGKEETRHLLDYWCDHCLAIITDKVKIDALCQTRRSAGLPHLFAALACADAATTREKGVLRRLVATFMPIARQSERHEDSCHARNILRAIFRESAIGEETLLWAEEALVFCIDGFADPNWALRNTSSMLYSTLCMRMFGVKKSTGLEEEERMSANEFFTRFPRLEHHLLEIVETSSAHKGKDIDPRLLPSLLIIQRLIPTGTSRNEHRFLAALTKLVQSHLWKCRVSSARSFCALNSDLGAVQAVFGELKQVKGQNATHGMLLILDEFASSQSEMIGADIVDYLTHNFDQWCSVNQALAVKLITSAANVKADLVNFTDKVQSLFAPERHAQIVDIYLYEQAAAFLLNRDDIKQVLCALNKSKPNGIRALTMQMDNGNWSDFIERNAFELGAALERVVFDAAYEDETKTAAASILLSCGSRLSWSIEEYTRLITNEMQDMKRPEFVGYLVELIEQKEPITQTVLNKLTEWIQMGITAEKRCSLRLSCAYVVASLIKKGNHSPAIFNAVCTLLTDEDDEVRKPLIDELGELCPFNPNRLLELIGRPESPRAYIGMLLRMGFNNERTTVRLFSNERDMSEFDLVDLNNNYEPLMICKFAIICMSHIISQIDDNNELKQIAGDIQGVFGMLQKMESTTIRREQIILLSDFIANI